MRAVKQLVAALLEIVANRGTAGAEWSIREPSWEAHPLPVGNVVIIGQQFGAALEFFGR